MRYSITDFNEDIERPYDEEPSRLLPRHYRELVINYVVAAVNWLQEQYGVKFDYQVTLCFTKSLEPSAEVQLLSEDTHTILISRGLLLRVAALAKFLHARIKPPPNPEDYAQSKGDVKVAFIHPGWDAFEHAPGDMRMEEFLNACQLSPDTEAFAYDMAARAILFAVLHELGHVGLYHHGLLQGANASELRGFEVQADLFALNNFLRMHGYNQSCELVYPWYATQRGWAVLEASEIQRVLQYALEHPGDEHVQSMHLAARCSWILLSALRSDVSIEHAPPWVRWWTIQNFIPGQSPEWPIVAIAHSRGFTGKLLQIERGSWEGLLPIAKADAVSAPLLLEDAIAAYRRQRSVIGTAVFPGSFPIELPIKAAGEPDLPWKAGGAVGE